MLTRLKNLLSHLHHDTSGAMAVEKVLLVALISLPILILAVIFRNTIMGWFNNWSGNLEGQPQPPIQGG